MQRKHQHLYNNKRWRSLRLQIFIRDNYICQQTGVLLSGKYPAPNSPVADHIIKHDGDEELFWDIDNIQSVSKQYHDSIKQSIEKGGTPKVQIGIDGWPVQ